MELAAKIIFFTGAWYAIGILGMLYVHHWYNIGVSPTSPEYQKITAREIFVLACLGLVIIVFLAIAEIHYRLIGKG